MFGDALPLVNMGQQLFLCVDDKKHRPAAINKHDEWILRVEYPL